MFQFFICVFLKMHAPGFVLVLHKNSQVFKKFTAKKKPGGESF